MIPKLVDGAIVLELTAQEKRTAKAAYTLLEQAAFHLRTAAAGPRFSDASACCKALLNPEKTKGTTNDSGT
jgi:hypothetical protein